MSERRGRFFVHIESEKLVVHWGDMFYMLILSRIGIGVGTPARLLALLDSGPYYHWLPKLRSELYVCAFCLRLQEHYHRISSSVLWSTCHVSTRRKGVFSIWKKRPNHSCNCWPGRTFRAVTDKKMEGLSYSSSEIRMECGSFSFPVRIQGTF